MSSNPAQPRSWTANEQEVGAGKWLLIAFLSVLLVVALVVFLFNLPNVDLPKTFAVSIAVPKYTGKQDLPEPAYANWSMEQVAAEMEARGLKSWAHLPDATWNSTGDFDFSDFRKALQDAQANSRDTLVVYLRCHALVIHGRAYALTGEFDGSSILQAEDEQEPEAEAPQYPGAVPFESIYRQLGQLPVSNVILLADVCDLVSVPRFGVMANNVVQAMGNDCARLKGGPRLWVITAAAPLQFNHESHARRQTLLQSACQYACDARRTDLQESSVKAVSLAGLYESMVRYCYEVTGGAQTPWMFCSGSPAQVSPDSKVWTDAQKISLATFSGVTEDNGAKDTNPAESDADKKSAQVDRRSAFQLVTHRLELPQESGASSSPQTSPSTQSTTSQSTTIQPPTTQPSPTDGVASGAATTADAPPDNSPLSKFWRLHRTLRERKNPSGWSPVDFGVPALRKAELEMISLERRERIGDRSPGGNMQSPKQLEQLELLATALANGTAATGTSGELIDSYNRFLDEIQAPDNSKLAWDDRNTELLPDDVRNRWIAIRRNYRLYIDDSSQLPAWMQLALWDANWLQDVEKLIEANLRVQQSLPKDGQSSVLENPLSDEVVGELTRTVALMRARLSREVQAMLVKVISASKNNDRLQWSDEHKVQNLLRSGLLDEGERKKLREEYDKLTEVHLEQPGLKHNTLDTKRSLAELLSTADGKTSLFQLANWSRICRRAFGLATLPQLDTADAESPDRLNDWGRRLQIALREPATDLLPAVKWNVACLNEYQLVGGEFFSSVLIMGVSSDTSVDVKLKESSVYLPSDLAVDVTRRNGERINLCKVTWNLLNEGQYQRPRQEVLRLFDQKGIELLPGRPVNVDVNRGRVTLRGESKLDARSTPKPIEIELTVFDSKRAVSIHPANPDSVDLYALWKNAPQSAAPFARSEFKSIEGVGQNSVLSALRVPALAGNAVSTYELKAFNLSDKEKKVRALLYDVRPTSNDAVGDGRVRGAAIQRTLADLDRIRPAFESEVVDLPPSQIRGTTTALPAGLQSLVFKRSAAAPPPTEPVDASAAIGEFGLLCVIEEVEQLENNVVRRKPQSQPYLHWIDVVGDNPIPFCLEPARLIPNGQSFELSLQVRQDAWNRWKLEKLPIRLRLTDSFGSDLPFDGATGDELNPDKPAVNWDIRPRVDKRQTGPSRAYVVHVDIGGYPRAVNFESRLDDLPEPAREARQSFLWLDPNSVVLLSTAGEPLPLPKLPAGQLVVPNRLQVTGESKGEEAKLGRLLLPIQADFPANRQLNVSFGQLPVSITTDRRLRPLVAISGSELRLSATVEDLMYERDMANISWSGPEAAQVEVVGDDNAKVKADLIFDKEPPETSQVDLGGVRELYLEESIEVSIRLDDQDSAVSDVYFAIDMNNVDPGNFDSRDMVRKPARPTDDGRWVAILQDTDLVAEQLPAGRLTVVSRCVDLAGNYRDDHRPAVFSWMNKKRPVSQPKPAPKEPTKPKPEAKPLEPKTYTVSVRVTVAGATPDFPDKVDASGVPGSKAQVKNIVKFLEVQPGDYEVAASYVDPFGVKYSGKKSVHVGENSSNSMTIDVARE